MIVRGDIRERLDDLGEGYRVVYADPPWAFRDACNAGKRGAAHKYATLTTDELCALAVELHCADDCACLLWCPSSMLPDGLRVLDAWDFAYRTVAFVWVKVVQDFALGAWRKAPGQRLATWIETLSTRLCAIGLGHHTRQNAELCLLGIRGRPTRVDCGVGQTVLAPRLAHSAKPGEVRARIERWYGDVKKLEMFARGRVPSDWDAIGLEVEPINKGTENL